MLRHKHTIAQNPERLVVLGASGFVGQAIVKQAQHHDIPTLAIASREVDLSTADAADKLAALLQPQDCVIFVSAIDKGNASTGAILLQNIAMAQQVAAAVAQVEIAQLIYISSDAVYPFGMGLVNEQTPAAPTTIYGTMHRTREILLENALTCPLAILRLTAIYGAGDTHNAYGPNRFLRQAQAEGIITLFGDGEEMRDHLQVDDAARLILATACHASSGMLNLNSGRSLSFRQVAEIIAAPTGASITTAPRRMPITHRHYDVTARLAAFPGFVPVGMVLGLTKEK